MSTSLFILAAGITPGMVFAIAVFILWVFGAVMNKKKPDDLKKPSREAIDLAEARRRIREQQNAQKPAITPRIQQLRAKQQKKAKQRQQPPALPKPNRAEGPPAQVSPITSSIVGRSPLPSAEVSIPAVPRRPQSETGTNVRLMLQKNGIREAFVLGEILGPPKAWSDG